MPRTLKATVADLLAMGELPRGAQTRLAREFGVSRQRVSQIVAGQRREHAADDRGAARVAGRRPVQEARPARPGSRRGASSCGAERQGAGADDDPRLAARRAASAARERKREASRRRYAEGRSRANGASARLDPRRAELRRRVSALPDAGMARGGVAAELAEEFDLPRGAVQTMIRAEALKRELAHYRAGEAPETSASVPIARLPPRQRAGSRRGGEASSGSAGGGSGGEALAEVEFEAGVAALALDRGDGAVVPEPQEGVDRVRAE